MYRISSAYGRYVRIFFINYVGLNSEENDWPNTVDCYESRVLIEDQYWYV